MAFIWQDIQLPIGKFVELAVDWLQQNLQPIWDALTSASRWLVGNLESGLMYPAPLIVAVVLALLAWLLRDVKFGAFTLLAFALVDILGFWQPAMRTAALTIAASFVALLLGVPLGIAASRRRAISSVVRPLLDFMQTLPPFVYLVPVIFFFDIGTPAAVFATLVFSVPPAVRLTELGIRQVDTELIEAGQSFGATPNQILFKIQFPAALPTIMAGVNQVIMLALSMAVIAGMVGAGGLGSEVMRSLSTLNVGLGFEAGLSVVVLAIYMDRLTEGIAWRIGRRPAQDVSAAKG